MVSQPAEGNCGPITLGGVGGGVMVSGKRVLLMSDGGAGTSDLALSGGVTCVGTASSSMGKICGT